MSTKRTFSTQQPEAQAAPRVPLAHGDQERPEDPGLASRQGPQAPQRVRRQPDDRNPGPIAVERLRVRREFLYVAEGYSERRRLLVVQGRRDAPERDIIGEGFTTTKKVGGSVVRNRARRRLREASRVLSAPSGAPRGRLCLHRAAGNGSAPWPRLLDDMETALISLRRRILTDGAPSGRLRHSLHRGLIPWNSKTSETCCWPRPVFWPVHALQHLRAGAPAEGCATAAPGCRAERTETGDVSDPDDQTAPGSGAAELGAGQRVAINAPAIDGSISLKGSRIDDVSLKNFYETIQDKEAAARSRRDQAPVSRRHRPRILCNRGVDDPVILDG